MMRSQARSAYPTRFWLFVIFGIGFPGVVDFGPAGRGAEHSLFTATSLGQLALTFICLLSILAITLAGRKAIRLRPLAYDFNILWALLLWLTITTIISPKDNYFISFYRLGEWLLGFVLFISIYTREPEENAPALAAETIGKICWGCIFLVWAFLLVHSPLAYQAIDDTTGADQLRLGGTLIHPIRLGVMSVIAFWYSFFFGRRIYRLTACTFAFVTMILAYSRIAWIGFAVGVILYAIARKDWRARVGIFAVIAVGLPLSVIYSDKLLLFVSRGRGASDLTSGNDRLPIWLMARQIIVKRPLLGYGYIDGVKVALTKVPLLTWGVPRHLQNDLLQLIGEGGVIAGVLGLILYGRLLFDTVKGWRHSVYSLFFAFVFIELLIYSLGENIFGNQITQPGVMLIVCLTCVPELRRYAARSFGRTSGGQMP